MSGHPSVESGCGWSDKRRLEAWSGSYANFTSVFLQQCNLSKQCLTNLEAKSSWCLAVAEYDDEVSVQWSPLQYIQCELLTSSSGWIWQSTLSSHCLWNLTLLSIRFSKAWSDQILKELFAIKLSQIYFCVDYILTQNFYI